MLLNCDEYLHEQSYDKMTIPKISRTNSDAFAGRDVEREQELESVDTPSVEVSL
jgi:hypothetical protein